MIILEKSLGSIQEQIKRIDYIQNRCASSLQILQNTNLITEKQVESIRSVADLIEQDQRIKAPKKSGVKNEFIYEAIARLLDKKAELTPDVNPNNIPLKDVKLTDAEIIEALSEQYKIEICAEIGSDKVGGKGQKAIKDKVRRCYDARAVGVAA